MAIIAILTFGATFGLCAYALWSTLGAYRHRIVDLLINGPVAMPTLPAPVPARSALRNVTVRRLAPTAATPRRAVA